MDAFLGRIVSAAFDLALAGLFLVTWLNPDSSIARPVEWMLLLMLLEFITVHSSAMLGSIWASAEPFDKRLRTIGLLTLMYALFVGGFSAGFGTWAPFIGFWVLSANRLFAMVVGGRPGPEAKRAAERFWARSVFLFVVGAFATTFVPVPRLGLTPTVMDGLDIAGSGLWVSEPWRVLAFGVFYYGISGLSLVRDALGGMRGDRSPVPAGAAAATNGE